MTVPSKRFDTIWEEKYGDGHQEKAPWDNVVSFIFRFRPQQKKPNETRILEVGCGTGSNLWFAALEGFEVTGLDASSSAINMAKDRFAEFDLQGDLRVGDFTKLPFAGNEFDLVVDRAALCCCGTSDQRKAISEIQRVLKPGGSFLYTPYSDTHSSKQTGRPAANNLTVDISGGTLTSVGQIRFIGKNDIEGLFDDNDWQIVVMEHHAIEDRLASSHGIHSSWKIIAAKK